MESNDKFELARRIINHTGTSLFLTGKAGTGKTTFLRHLRTSSRKRMVVAAPTGIAAINAGGVTLHSFFQLDFGMFIPGMQRRESGRRAFSFGKEKIRIIRGLDLLVIDEVSMVRADLLDAVDAVLRRYRDHSLPFGGVQLLLIGDLQQLPPVVTESERPLLEQHYPSPYFFDSHALRQLDYVTIELDKVYRQNDADFLSILNSIRDNRLSASLLSDLNSRYIPGFTPDDNEGYVRLTTHNRLADSINRQRLDALPGEEFIFEAQVEGQFPESSFPAERQLRLKEKAQVMFIKNDTGTERRFFNGMLGKVSRIEDGSIYVIPADSTEEIEVPIVEWENVRFAIDEETKEIKENLDGVFRQIPLKTAWAITIHKSQGLTFDRAIIDASAAFAHGQTYVALSRCRTLEGLVLERPLSASAIISDPTVSTFMNAHTLHTPGFEDVKSMSHAYFMALAESMFDFHSIFNLLEDYSHIAEEAFMETFPSTMVNFKQTTSALKAGISEVSAKFRMQLRRIDAENSFSEEASQLLQRIKDACRYFLSQLAEISAAISEIPEEHDNKDTQRRLNDRLEALTGAISMRHILLDNFRLEDFSIELYHEIKAQGAFLSIAKKKKKEKSASMKEGEMEATVDNHHPLLFNRLTEWRKLKMKEEKKPVYLVMSTKTLLTIANTLPETFSHLAKLKGLGPVKIKNYGDELLDIVDAYKEEFGIRTEQTLFDPPKPAPKPKKEPKAKKEPKPKKEPKEKGPSSQSQTLMLWNEGMTPEEIAQARGFAVSTIIGHLIKAVEWNEANTNRIVSPEKQEIARRYFATHPKLPETLTEIRAEMEEALEFNELHIMLRHCGLR